MKKFLYALIYFFLLGFVFRGFLTETAESMGINLPIAEMVFFSKDNGQTWNKLETNNNKVKGNALFFNQENYSDIFIASNGGVLKLEEKNEKNIVNKNNQIKNKLNSSQIVNFIQNQQSPNIFYLVLNDIEKSELLISYDYGENFKTIFKIDNTNKISVFKINPINTNYLYVGTRGGLFLVSHDGGNSWQKKKSFSPGPIKDIAINEISGDIYISVFPKTIDFFSPSGTKEFSSSVYKSTDGGNSFSKIKKLNGVKIKKIETVMGKDEVYFVSDYGIFFLNQGKFSELNLISLSKNEKIGAFTINPKNSNILYVAISDILYKTTNGGETWSIVETPARHGNKIKDIKINPENTNLILITLTN